MLDWRPFLLRPETPPEGLELPAYVKARIADPNDPLKARAKRLGLELNHRPRIPPTRHVHELAALAGREGRAEAFHRAILTAYWRDGADLTSPAALQACLAEAGLDGPALLARQAAGEAADEVEAALQQARALGVSAVPTFVVDGRVAVQGAHEAATFRQLFARLGIAPTLL